VAAAPGERERLERHLTDLDAETLLKAKGQGEPVPIDRALSRAGGVVLLGGPGSGKTTLVKRLTRSFALGPEAAKERFPGLPWCFPIAVSAAQFDDNRGERNLFDYLRDRFEEEWGRALVEVFLRHWGEGNCLVLIDGLDEVADTGRRIGCARVVGEFVSKRSDNPVLVTSRPVGYSLCRISEPVEHVVLRPFERADIEAFVTRWHVAYDQAVHPERPDRVQAESDARDLMDDIKSNPRIESLATNPLMLTIIALIKHQNVALPERRVELYEIALNTLIRSWNKARSLANRPIGEDLSLADAKKVWADVARWMHAEKSTGTCPAAQLQQRVVDVLTADGMSPLAAERTAESYITAAAERSGLLEARGANVFAFMHQTFQEYLAAQHLAKPHRKVIERVLEVAPDPRWREVIRLTAGYIGVIQADDEIVTELVAAIAEDERDPLEPYLCGALRLAASCIADDVRARPPLVDRVIATLCNRLNAPYSGRWEALAQALASMRMMTPGPTAVTALSGLADHESWRVRMEAARMLSRVAVSEPKAVECLHKLFADRDADVKAHAALGLWRSGLRQDDAIPKAILYGLTSPAAAMPSVRGLDLVQTTIRLLEDQDANVRFNAAWVLGDWGHQAEALPALIRLLEHQDANVRWNAASVLGGWGHQAEVLPALIRLLEDQDANVRWNAASVLGGWGHQAEALPALIRLLEHQDANIRSRMIHLLGRWGGGHNAASTVLSQHLGLACPQAVAYLESDPEGKPRPPDPETAQFLAEAIRPDPSDSLQVQGLRRVVFEWVWQMAPRGA
jgi:tetratricopeptide (TPR) repeat protein